MKKEQLGTRVEAPLGQRLRIYAAITGRTVEDVVSAALDGYLPATAEMVRDGASSVEDLLAGQPGVA